MRVGRGAYEISCGAIEESIALYDFIENNAMLTPITPDPFNSLAPLTLQLQMAAPGKNLWPEKPTAWKGC
jgi:hypothetical protein